jgi:hypothetical protein
LETEIKKAEIKISAYPSETYDWFWIEGSKKLEQISKNYHLEIHTITPKENE